MVDMATFIKQDVQKNVSFFFKTNTILFEYEKRTNLIKKYFGRSKTKHNSFYCVDIYMEKTCDME